MNPDKKRYLSYICPQCRQSVIVERDLFTLAAAPNRIKCPCGKSELTVDFQPDLVHMTVPCVFCGRDHKVACPSSAFAQEKALAFSCSASAFQARPHPAVISRGTGISRPGSPAAWQARSMAMAPVVVAKVTTNRSSFFRMVRLPPPPGYRPPLQPRRSLPLY